MNMIEGIRKFTPFPFIFEHYVRSGLVLTLFATALFRAGSNVRPGRR